jgi:hypothetical protein
MSLQTDALDLLGALTGTVEALNRFQHPSGGTYGPAIAARLAPAVAEFEQAVIETRSREAAVRALVEIDRMMDGVSAASTKGELRIFPAHDDQTLDTYWRLNKIFRESKYASESL